MKRSTTTLSTKGGDMVAMSLPAFKELQRQAREGEAKGLLKAARKAASIRASQWDAGLLLAEWCRAKAKKLKGKP